MTDPQTVAEHLAAIRRMVARAEHKSDILAALAALALAWVEPAPAVDEPTLEAQLAEATGRQQRALVAWQRFSDSANLAKLDAAYLERNRIIAAIRARDAAKAPAVDESEPVNRNPGEET